MSSIEVLKFCRLSADVYSCPLKLINSLVLPLKRLEFEANLLSNHRRTPPPTSAIKKYTLSCAVINIVVSIEFQSKIPPQSASL